MPGLVAKSQRLLVMNLENFKEGYSLKSKKLFAILTLVAFMMTLLPMAAFAMSVSASYITTDKDSVATSSTSIHRPIKITFVGRDANGAALAAGTNVLVYLTSNNDATAVGVLKDNYVAGLDVSASKTTMSTDKEVYLVSGTEMVGSEGAEVVLKMDSNGRAVLYAYSKIGGTAKLGFYNKAKDADDELLIGEKTLTFEASAASINGIKFDSTHASTTAGTEQTIKAQVYDSNNNGMEGKEVTFYVQKGSSASFVSLGTATTDDLGIAQLKYTPTAAKDNYDLKAVCGEKSKVYSAQAGKAKFDVDAAAPIKIEAKEEAVYADKDLTTKIKFFLYDSYGNKVYKTDYVTITYSAVPSDSGLEDDALTDLGDATDKYWYGNFTPDVEGLYTVKAKINSTGLSTSTKVTVGDFGTVQSVTVKLADDDDIGIKTTNKVTGSTTRLASANSNTLRVKLVDENGLEKNATSDDVVMTSNNTSLVSFEDSTAFNKAFGPIDNSKGTATVTVIHKDTGLSASLDINVVGGVSTLAETVAVSDKSANVTIQEIDSAGVKTFPGADTEYSVYVPSGVTISDKVVIDDKKGYGSFTVSSDSYGTKSVTVALATGTSKTFTITFAAPVPKAEGASEKVTMFIGNTGYVKDGSAAITDVAPFVQNGRTFVAVRPLADAFGAEIGWDETTKTVTLTRADKTVTIVIGSSTITVVSNGVTSTVTADEPAFVKDGRTVLPFRAVGEAFGYSVSYDATTQAVSYSL